MPLPDTQKTDHERATLALQVVLTARRALRRAIATLKGADDASLLSAPPMIERAIDELDCVAGDLEDELARIEEEDRADETL